MPNKPIKNSKLELNLIEDEKPQEKFKITLQKPSKIKNYLEAPSNKITRIYKVKVQGIVCAKTIKKIQQGLIINNINYKVKAIKVISATKSYSWVLKKLEEGKNNHIRKIIKTKL